MKISYLGHSCFYFDCSTSFVFDPFDGIGYKMPKVKADVCLCSHSHGDHHATNKVDYNTLIDTPVCEKIGSLSVSSMVSSHDNVDGKKRGKIVVYKIECDGVTVAHLGDIGFVDEKVVNFVKDVDILLLPVGGFFTIDHNQAKDFALLSKAKTVVPMHYKTKGCLLPISPLSSFASLFDEVKTVPSPCEYDDLPTGIVCFEK